MKATASRALLGAAIVAAACGLLRLAGADLEFVAVALLLAVVGASLLGYAAGFAAAATGFVLLLYAFTPPIGRVVVRYLNDFFVGVAFFVGALVTGFLVARLNELRRRSER